MTPNDRRRAAAPIDPALAIESSSLRLYAKGKPARKDVSVSRFTGALFNDDPAFVHPLTELKNKKKKGFSWNPFKRSK